MVESKNNITVLVDIDDTIENLCEVWVDMLNLKYGTTVKYEDINSWDLPKFFPTLSREQVFAPLHSPEIWYSLRPKKGARYYLKKLISEGFDVYLCTTTYYKNVQWKYEGVIEKYFPFISWDNVIITSNKQLIHADFLVDDAPHNLEGGSYNKILVSAPHNRSCNAEENGFIRCDTWSEIYGVLKDYQKEQTLKIWDYKPKS